MNLIQQNMIYQILMYRKIKNRTCGNWKCTTEFDKIDYLLMEYVLQMLIRWINLLFIMHSSSTKFFQNGFNFPFSRYLTQQTYNRHTNSTSTLFIKKNFARLFEENWQLKSPWAPWWASLVTFFLIQRDLWLNQNAKEGFQDHQTL